MDKNAIFNYVEYAREELQKLIKQKAFEYGITDKGAQRGLNVINGRLLSKEELNERDALLLTIESKEDSKGFANGYEIVMEEVSYTWFNRFIALRFMEVNGYLPSHTRVFSDENGRFNPQILKEALTLDIYGIDRLKVSEMVQNNQNEELFKYLIILQCNALSKPMPRMFERIENYTELLFPNGLLKKGSIIDRLVSDINEEDWKDQVQIIGWMYQFYVASRRQSLRGLKATKERLPIKSQIFTPDWIVRYMAENSIGRIWLESNPNSPLKSEMKYYVEDANQEEDIQKKLEEIRYKDVNPEDIKIIEPCCGSGHILVYCFDLLYKMYLEKGYSQRDIATLILKNNLYGLDVDNRAAQLAYFSVMMKARSVDKQYLTRDTVQQPKVYEIIDSQQLINHNYESLLKETRFSEKSIGIARYLVSTYKNGKVIGSLLKVNRYDYKELIDEIKEKQRSVVPNLTIMDDWNICLPQLRQLAALAIIMSRKYDVMITNPPYIPLKEYDDSLKEYAINNYGNSKDNMGIMFMESNFTKNNGYTALVNPDSWMFLSSFSKVRKDLINNNYLVNMIHLGFGVFDATIYTTSFVFRKNNLDFSGTYFRLNDESDKEISFVNRTVIPNIKKISTFKLIPSDILGYWLTDKFISTFKNSVALSEIADPKQGLATADNNRFLRLWYEVSINNIKFDAHTLQEAKDSKCMWFPYNKGGELRKWYGNEDYVINYYNDGKELKEFKKSVIRNPQYYFKPSVSWSKIGTKKTAFRFKPAGHLFDVAGTSIFGDDVTEKYLIGLLNTKIVEKMLEFMSPSMNFEVGHIAMIPIIKTDNSSILDMVQECISISQEEWNSFEESWDFDKHPLIKNKNSISESFDSWIEITKEWFDIIKKNEEKLNKIFISLYELDSELTYNIDDKDIYMRLADLDREIKSLISYAIGVSFGRYSLDVEGLAYAGGDWNPELYSTIIPDDNNIIPILDDGYYPDDAMNKVIEFLTKVYGKNTLDENLKFIADALGGNGTSKEVIRNYLINGFYTNHLKIYKKRPIYWLFDAGKQNSFKALIYMHRYTPDLLAKMRTDYILPLMDKYSSRIAYLEKEIPTLTGTLATKSRKELDKVRAQLKELSEYEPKIHHLADERISIDLDDGVKHNYELFKDVLAPLK